MIKEINFLLKSDETYRNCIYENYQCNCTKEWKENNRVIIYFLTKKECTKILDKPTDNIFDFFQEISEICLNKLKDNKKTIIAGGHTVVNLKDRNYVSEEVKTSVNLGMSLLLELKKYVNDVDFLIPLNDFFMEKDAGNNENLTNSYRKEALDPYILPESLEKIFKEFNKKTDFKLFFCSEKNMADKFKRHIKNAKKINEELFKNYGTSLENWAYLYKEKEIEVISNNKPNCVAGNAATFRDINFIVNNSKIKNNYDSHIGIYPLCSLNNVVNGYLIGNEFYNLDLPTILIFYDKKCF